MPAALWCLHAPAVQGHHSEVDMFVFFSNKLGCLGSIIVSIVATLLLLLLFGVL